MHAFNFVGGGVGGGGDIGGDASQEALAVFGVLRLQRVPALLGERAEARLVRFRFFNGRNVVISGHRRAIAVAWEAGEEVRDDGGLAERHEREAFAFEDGIWGVLVVWGKEDVPDDVAGIQEGVQ